jgi:prepilin-type N-terminal cleavage/methylation domain-containing protein
MHTLNYRSDNTKKGFTLIELLVVIAIIALLMSILMPALNRVKSSAKAAACQSNLHQWGIIWMTYAQDHEGRFQRGAGGESQTGGGRWPAVVRDYYRDDKIRLCPMATKPLSEGGVNPLAAWGKFDDGMYASYGFNEWLCNRPFSEGEGTNYWRYVFNIPNSNKIPLFLDCYWYDVWVHSIDNPPQTDGSTSGMAGSNEIRRVCLNRHNYAVNCVFLDWSVRKVDLKELWTLKWHKNYNTRDIWTLAGGVTEDDWPEWMKGLKAY